MTRTHFVNRLAVAAFLTASIALSACGGETSSTDTAARFTAPSGSSVTTRRDGWAKYQRIQGCSGAVSAGAKWSAARYKKECKAVFDRWHGSLGSSPGSGSYKPSGMSAGTSFGLADPQTSRMQARFCSAMSNAASGKIRVAGVSRQQAKTALGCSGELVVWDSGSSSGDRTIKIDTDDVGNCDANSDYCPSPSPKEGRGADVDDF